MIPLSPSAHGLNAVLLFEFFAFIRAVKVYAFSYFDGECLFLRCKIFYTKLLVLKFLAHPSQENDVRKVGF